MKNLIFAALVAAPLIGTMAGARTTTKLVCRTSSTLTIAQNKDGSFDATVKIEGLDFSAEAIQKQFPTLDPSVVKGMAAQALKTPMAQPSLGRCAHFSKCDFASVGSNDLAVCTSKTSQMKMSIEDGSYKINCSTIELADPPSMDLHFKSATLERSYPLDACTYE